VVVRPVLATLLALTTTRALGADLSEYQVKAAFLYNFARYVEWPEDAAPAFRICVLGDDPFGATLPDAVRDKRVRERPVEVAHPDPGDLAGCHLLFVAASEAPLLPRLLAGVGGAHVLTVGESEGFTRAGGMIRMRIEENKVRFDVNLEAAQRVGLRISSQLLKLATQVIQ
jgi:hypothetical protein